MSQLARLEAEVGDIRFGISDVTETALLVGTQGGAVGKDAYSSCVTAYVAHDVAVAPQAIVLSQNSILVAIATLDASMICQFAHQGSHDNAQFVVVVDRASPGIAVEQLAAFSHLAREGSHTVDVILSRKRAGLDAEMLDGADDVVEKT